MGIDGLIPYLGESVKKCRLDEFSGCSVAVDAYWLLHKGTFSCAEQLVRGETTTAYVQYCLKYVNLLLSFRIKPIMVFDGQRLSAKKAAELKRRKQETGLRRSANQLLLLGKPDEANFLYRKCLYVTYPMAYRLIRECRNINVDCIVAPYEADAQMAYLNLQGIVDLVITNDSDLVVFGCKKILFDLDLEGNGMLVEKENLIKAMKMTPDKYTFAKFRHMCILSGCDYVESLPDIGLRRAHIAVHMTYDNIGQLLRKFRRYLFFSHIIITPEFDEQVKIADACFQHQIVYDPCKRQLVHLTPPKASGISQEYLKRCGQFYDNAKAYQLALGNIDPITYQVLDTWNPDDDNKMPSTSIWSKTYTEQEAKLTVSGTPILNAKSTKGEQVVAKVSQAAIIVAEAQIHIEISNKLAEDYEFYWKHQRLPPAVAEALRREIKFNEEIRKQVQASSTFLKFGTSKNSLQLDNENSISKNHTIRNKVPKPETIVRASEIEQNRNNNTSLIEIQNNLPDTATRATVENYQLDNEGLLSNDENIEDNTSTGHSLLLNSSEIASVLHKTKGLRKRKLPEQNKITGMLPYIKKKTDL